MKTTIAAVVVLAGVAQAQYALSLFFTDGDDCPNFLQSERSQLETWTSGSNKCIDIHGNCPEGHCNIGVTAPNIGMWAGMPKKIGACPGYDCSSNCKTWDVEQGVNGFRVDCAEFTGEWYFYVGN